MSEDTQDIYEEQPVFGDDPTHPSVYENLPVVREDYTPPRSIDDDRTTSRYVRGVEEPVRYEGDEEDNDEAFANGFAFIKLGLTSSTIKTGRQGLLWLDIDDDEKKLTVEQAKTLYPETEFTEPIHPIMAAYYSDVNKSELKVMADFARTGYQTDDYGNLIASWAGMVVGTLADIPETLVAGAIGGAVGGHLGALVGAGLNVARRVGRAARFVMKASKMAKLASAGVKVVSRPMAKLAASAKLARVMRFASKSAPPKSAKLVGTTMIKNADEMLREAKVAARVKTLKTIGKSGVANAAIEANIAMLANQRGATYDMKTAAAFGLFAPMVLHGAGRAIMGVGAPAAKATGKVVRPVVNKGLEEAVKHSDKFFKGTKVGRSLGKRMSDFKFNLVHKVASNWGDFVRYVERVNTDPTKLSLIEDGMSGRALSENPLIKKIEAVFGKKGMQVAHIWATSMRLNGIRVDLQDAFPWLSKSVDEIRMDIKTGKMSGNAEKAFRGKFEDWDRYIKKHTVYKSPQTEIPKRSKKEFKTADELDDKINGLMKGTGDVQKYGEELNKINKLMKDFTDCLIKPALKPA